MRRPLGSVQGDARPWPGIRPVGKVTLAPLCAILALWLCVSPRAQDNTAPPERALVEEALADAGRQPEGPEREALVAALNEALANLDAIAGEPSRQAVFDEARDRAREALPGLEARIAAGDEPPLVAEDVAEMSEEALEAHVSKLDGALAEARKKAEAAHNEVLQREERRAGVPRQLAEIDREIAGWALPGAADGEAPELTQARRWAARARRGVLDARRATLQRAERNLRDEVLGRWRQATVELADREVAALVRATEAARAALQRRRQAEAIAEEAQIRDEAKAAEGGHPLVVLVNRELLALAEQKTELTEQTGVFKIDAEKLRTLREKLEKDLEALRQRFEALGLTEAVGAILRQQAAGAREALRQAEIARAAQRHFGESQLRQLELERIFDALQVEGDTAAKVAGLGLLDPENWPAGEVPEGADEFGAVADKLEALFARQLDAVRELRGLHKGYSDAAIRLELEAELLQAKARELLAFTGERVLWIRSAPPIWKPNTVSAMAGLRWLMSPESWAAALAHLGAHVLDNPVLWFGIGLLLALLVALRRWGRRRLRVLGEAAAKGASATFALTLRAFVWTLLRSLPVAVTLHLVGVQLGDGASGRSFAAAAGAGFEALALWVWGGSFVVELARPAGLGERHFKWTDGTLRLMRRHVRWSVVLLAPSIWALIALEQHGNDPWRQSTGRLALLVLLTVLAVVQWRFLHPRRGFAALQEPSRPSLLRRWARGWFFLGLGLPVGLIVLACLGYQFTAAELTLRLLATLGLLLALMVINGMVLRALALARRDLAMRQARERREAAKEAKAAGEEPPEPTIDLGAIGQQMRSLVRGSLALLLLVGAWLLWVDVLPALGVLREVTLWSDSVVGVDGKVETQRVTLASFLLAAVYVGITLLAARNIGGFLELVVLQRTDLQAGERNAITTIGRYVVLGIGFGLAFGAVGIGWSKVQWLVAALGVGLGFGLQEIFANFVSGLIILFERPIRVGDLVTVAGVDGTVSQIRIRSTVITDYDRREMIIPNKEFITGSVTNWSLTDTVSRVVLRVGVAYGTDTRRVRQVLLDCARSSSLVLETPGPSALFAGFGDSSLDFQLRVFLASRDDYPALLNDLNTRIDEQFKEAGFEIPFPQRDLHLRSSVESFGAQATPAAGG